MKTLLRLLAILFLIMIVTASPALALGPGYAHQSLKVNILELVAFLKSFTLTSVALGTFVAMLVNILKPLIPDGYADTAATMVTFVLLAIVAGLKIANPDLQLAGLEELFNSIIESSVIWLVPLTYVV